MGAPEQREAVRPRQVVPRLLRLVPRWGRVLRRQGGQIGMDRAERWVALSDGGSGLEAFLRGHFPRVEAVILDFYHAAEHLGRLAQAWLPGSEAAAQALHGQWCEQLKHEGGQALLATLGALDLRGKRPAVRAVYAEEVGYFTNQVHRMDYPTYRARCWQIGSGPAESALDAALDGAREPGQPPHQPRHRARGRGIKNGSENTSDRLPSRHRQDVDVEVVRREELRQVAS